MGLLSFLSKQPLRDRSRTDVHLTSQAYHATVASRPPVKGTYPVPGNGPTSVKRLSRAHDKINESQLSLNFLTPSEIPPVPAVSRLRDESPNRPSTAPIRSDAATDSNRLRKSNSRGRPPPLSLRKARKPSLAPESSRGRSDAKTAASPGPVSAIRPRLLGASSPASSVRSDALKGSKDLLDAQSEFKPSDFRTRVKAAGVRDYGEDVADRNIGQNGVDLESAEVQEFYAQSTSGFLARTTRCASMADISLQYLNDDTRGRPASKKTPTSSGLRAKSENSLNHCPFPLSAIPPVPRVPTVIPQDGRSILTSNPSTTSKLDRRQTVNSYVPTGPVETSRSHLKRRSLSLQRAEAPRRPSPVPANDQTDHQDSPRDSLSTVRQPSIQKKPLDPATLAQKKADHQEVDPNHDDTFVNHVSPGERSFSMKSASRRCSIGSAATFGYTTGNLHGTRHALHSSISSVASRDTATDNTNLAYPQDRSRFRPPHDDGSIVAAAPAGLGISASDSIIVWTPPSAGAAHGKPRVSGNHTRTQSLASSLRTLKLDEVSDVVPARTSSVRHWSISSTTPTTSDASSNPSQRPQSRHTADTSIDPRNSFSAKNSSHGSLTSAIGAHSVTTSPKTAKSSAFNIDDYISSDEDYMSPRRPRGEGEEDLLFQDSGYGMNGSLLPGLFDGMPLPGLSSDSQRHLHPPRTSSSLPPGYLKNAYSSPTFSSPGSFSAPRPRRYVIDTAAHYDDDVDGDEEDYFYHGGEDELPPLPGLSPVRGGGGFGSRAMRFTAQGRMYGGHHPSSHHHHRRSRGGGENVIEEERDMSKIDVGAAVKMRKEAKARKRADMAMARRRRSSRTGASRRSLTEVPDADDGHHADTEC